MSVVFDHTDPGLRPFIEVGAKITLKIFGQARASGASARELVASVADTSTADAEAGARELSDQLPSTRGLAIACREGCSYCCHGLVLASAPEILRIAAFVQESRSPAELDLLRERAARTAERVASLDLHERAAARVPCPLLDESNGACSAYEVRPIACRAYHSGSVDPCKKAFDDGDPNPVLPINPALFHVPHAYAFGMMTACAAEHVDPGPYDLAVALPAALAADLSVRWAAGEKVLPKSPLSEEIGRGHASTLDELVSDLAAGRLEQAARVAVKLDPEAARRERNKKKRERRSR